MEEEAVVMAAVAVSMMVVVFIIVVVDGVKKIAETLAARRRGLTAQFFNCARFFGTPSHAR